MIWAKEETLPRSEIEAIQLEKLKSTVKYIYERVEPYRRKMDEAKVKPEDITSLEDLQKLPLHIRQISRITTRTGCLRWTKRKSCAITRAPGLRENRRWSAIQGMIWTCGLTT